MYRELKLRAALLVNKELKLLPQEQLYTKVTYRSSPSETRTKIAISSGLLLSSEIRTASLQGTVDLIPICPLFRGPTVLQGTVDLIPMCPLFRGFTVLQGTVDLIPMCPLFKGSTVLQGTVDLIPMFPLFKVSTRDSRPDPNVSFIQRFHCILCHSKVLVTIIFLPS